MNPQINPLGFNYGMDTAAVVPFARPTAIIVTGRGNRYDPAFQEARKKGALVYAYANPLNLPDNLNNPQDQEQFLINGQRPPLWKVSGVERSNWGGTKLLDIRAGSAWLKQFESFVRAMIATKKFDGLFLDTLGARPWAADFDSWPAAERQLWTASCVGVARIAHDVRVALQPDFELVHNNIWQGAPDGEQYCNGVCIENAPADELGNRAQFHANYAARQFAGPPFARRLLVVSNRMKLFDQWKEDPNVTHIAFVNSPAGDNYMKLTAPLVPYNDLGNGDVEQRELERRVAELSASVDALTQQNLQLKKANEDLGERIAKIELHSAEISKLVNG